MKVPSTNHSQLKLPIPLGLLFLIASLITGIFFINKIRLWNLSASSEIAPQLIKITNIGSSSFVVSWTTKEKTTGLVSLGETPKLEGEKKNDIRDQNKGIASPFFLHYVLVDNLKPETKYYFKIVSGGKTNNRLFEAVTATLKVPADNDISQGKVLDSSNQPASGVIVYLSLANTLTQSALTDNNGNWMISLATARTLDLKDFSNYDRSAQIEEILVQGEDQTANATLITGDDNPTPNIILGQSHNFLGQIPKTSPTVTPIQNLTSRSGFNLPTGSENSPKDLELKIIFPEENEKVNNLIPEFSGTGPVDKKINILVESSNEITSETSIDPKGNWSWSPKTPLLPGEHTITVSYVDKQGFVEKVSHSFTVLATGESDLPSYTATPSGKRATPTPSSLPSPTQKPSPSPTPIPTVRTTVTPNPTATPTVSDQGETTVTPTSITASTPTPLVASQPTISPVSGTNLPTKFFIGTGVATILIGAALILF